MKVLFLPVDSRPCNSTFPQRLLEWCGAECILPPREVLDHFTRPSHWEGIQAFLTAHAAEADAWAISLDQLCFGSLLASRELAVTEEEALARLAWFEELRAQYPDKPVHAVNTILRTSISALRSSDLNIYNAMREYSYFSSKAEVTHSMEDMVRGERAARMIPGDMILRYHTVRQRNHRINAEAVRMAKRGTLSSLLLLMEDSEEFGFHRTEQHILQGIIGNDRHVLIKNGTDEGPLLAIKALGERLPAVDIRWLGRDDGNFVSKYEDRPFSENVNCMLDYLGMECLPDADIVLAIAASRCGIQQDILLNPSLPSYPEEERRAAAQVNDLLAGDRRVYLLDLFCCNGGWVDFVKGIDHPDLLAGYSAWNTSSNALGTIAGQICSDALAGRVNTTFRNERFLDDLLYESCIRQHLNSLLRAEGQDPYRLKDPEAAQRMMDSEFNLLFAQQGAWTHRFANIVQLLQQEGSYEVSFPWDRTFEVLASFHPENNAGQA